MPSTLTIVFFGIITLGVSALGKSLISGKKPFFANFSRAIVCSCNIVTLTKPVPFCFKSSKSAAFDERSIILSLTNGPLSFILNIKDLLFFKFVTLTELGSGKVL